MQHQKLYEPQYIETDISFRFTLQLSNIIPIAIVRETPTTSETHRCIMQTLIDARLENGDPLFPNRALLEGEVWWNLTIINDPESQLLFQCRVAVTHITLPVPEVLPCITTCCENKGFFGICDSHRSQINIEHEACAPIREEMRKHGRIQKCFEVLLEEVDERVYSFIGKHDLKETCFACRACMLPPDLEFTWNDEEEDNDEDTL
jgi:hypothetical protein